MLSDEPWLRPRADAIGHRLRRTAARARGERRLRYAPMLADQNLDAAFAALWSDPERNAAEADLDRRSDDEIDAGAGFRGSVEELLAAVDA